MIDPENAPGGENRSIDPHSRWYGCRLRFPDHGGFVTMPLPRQKIDRIMDAAKHLETMRDIKGLISLLMTE